MFSFHPSRFFIDFLSALVYRGFPYKNEATIILLWLRESGLIDETLEQEYYG